MTLEKIKQVALKMHDLLDSTVEEKQLHDESFYPYPYIRISHIKWMCLELQKFDEELIGKANRWLGFIQGFMWEHEIMNIKELKEHNK